MDFRIDGLSSLKGIASMDFRVGTGSNRWTFESIQVRRLIDGLSNPKGIASMDFRIDGGVATYDCLRCVETLTLPGQNAETVRKPWKPEWKPL